jgi:hypothetical protein
VDEPRRQYRYRIRGARLASETKPPPEETIRAASELNAVDAYFQLHGKRPIAAFSRIADAAAS